MSLHIVIDGYNLIRQSGQFRDIDRQDMQAGREALVDMLVSYKRIKGHAITIVFDGAAADLGMPRRDTLKGIKLRFSQPGELADAVIKRMASREKEKMLVVTSDNDIVSYAKSQGSTTVGADEFEARLMQVQYMDLKGVDESDETTGWQATTKKKGPSRRPSKQQRKQQRKISKL